MHKRFSLVFDLCSISCRSQSHDFYKLAHMPKIKKEINKNVSIIAFLAVSY